MSCGQTKNSPQFSSWILIGSNQANFARIIPETAGSSFCSFATVHGSAASDWLIRMILASDWSPSFVTLTLSWELLAAGDKRQFTKLHECSESASGPVRVLSSSYPC